MERFTEYHNGVAVIRDKALLKEAMRKLAGYEDVEELSAENGMEKITTEFAEYICDELCKWTDRFLNPENLEAYCAECKMGKFICDICNKYNEIDRFAGSELERLMMENAKLKKALEEMKG